MTTNSKKYYWIKLKTDFFNQETIDFLLSQKNGCEYIVLYQMLCLQTANNNGIMATKVGEIIMPYDINKIVRDTKYFDYDTVAVALELFKQLGLIYEEQNKILKITNLEEMVGSETSWAEKKRLYREKQKLLGNSQDKVEDIVREEIRDKSIDINKREINKEKSFKKPTVEEIETYCRERNNSVNPNEFYDFYESKGWYVGKNKMKDWKASVRTWENKRKNSYQENDKEVKLVRSGENSFHIGG